MVTVAEGLASLERNIATQTGRAVPEWVTLVRAQGLEKHGQMVAWLKGQGLSHGQANQVAKRALEAASPSTDGDPADALFAGKEGLRPIYDRLVEAVSGFGPDVEIAPKKANVSLRARKQFALAQPSTKTRLDLGLILAREARGRLESSGSFNAMFTHRVRLESLDAVDAELLGWLREAYDGAR